MLRFRIRTWLNCVLPRQVIRQRPRTAAHGIEQLESRWVLSTFLVTSTLDSVDATPGDGIAADVNGIATLRAAVMEANASSGADTISLDAGLFTMSVSGLNEDAATTGDLDVTGELIIEGAGIDQTTLDAAQLDRFFYVSAGSSLTLRNVTIQNGREATGAAIQNDGTLTLDNVNLTGNLATTRGGAIDNNLGSVTLQSVTLVGNETFDNFAGGSNANGGGLSSNGGTVTIQASRFADNKAKALGGAIYATSTTLNVTDTEFSQNSAMTGGAVRLMNGTANFTNDTFDGDYAAISGGAIASNFNTLTITGGLFTGNHLTQESAFGELRKGGALSLTGNGSSSPTVTITGTTFENGGSGDGGAIYNAGARVLLSNSLFDHMTGYWGGSIRNTSNGQMSIWNTTFVGGTGSKGGAILNEAQMQLTNCTVTDTTSLGGLTVPSAAVVNSGSLQVANNLIAGNVGGWDVEGNFFGPGGNLIGQRNAATGFNEPNDHVGTAAAPIDPLLMPLTDNGGPVKTMALQLQSPARDAGVQFGPSTDARGLPRSGFAFDAGAYEFQNHAPTGSFYNKTINYGEILNGQLLGSDSDGDILTFELLQPISGGTMDLQPDGSFTYTPPTEEIGTAFFVFRVTDGHSYSNPIQGRINVRPYNDPPVVPDQTFTVPENVRGYYVGFIDSFDVDSNQLTFEILSGNESGAFGINSQARTLFVTNTAVLNYEAQPSYTLVVRVTDNGIPAASTVATITVQLEDVNEPVQGLFTEYTIDENSPIGTVVGNVAFTDEDVGQSHTFEIVSSDNYGEFAIDPATGQLTVADPTQLDFETDPEKFLVISITDAGSPSSWTYAYVRVRLNNANDAPVIYGPDVVGIDENAWEGTFISAVYAYDVDPETSLTFAIVSGNTDGAFSIHPNYGAIQVANRAALNYEATNTFSLVVSVTDNGDPNLTSTKTITVFVNDLNEAPQTDFGEFTLDENAANGTVVGSVTGSDPDIGQVLTYTIFSGNIDGAFAIDPATGEITVANSAVLDYEAHPSFNVEVLVSDNGEPSYSALTTVTIDVNNINEAPIIFPATFSIDENAPTGAPVGSVFSSEPDPGQTRSYGIVSGNTDGAFSIDSVTGQIFVANQAALNFESTSSFNLVVSVTDDGTPPLTSTATITIDLINQNDAPQISAKSFTLNENSANNTVVGTITGTDQDPGQALTYSITAGNTNGAFSINAATGRITVANSAALNFETTPTFSLVVRATDNGSPSQFSNAAVTISLTNINETPVIAAQSFSLAENSANGTVVGFVAASDPDAGQSLTYAIVSGNSNDAFAINASTGRITVANSAALDFETRPTFALQVRVTDNGSPSRNSTAAVTISLTDVVEPLAVSLDVIPGSSSNKIRLGTTFEVAILSTSTFNARDINVNSIRFGKLGTENSARRNSSGQVVYSYRHVNGDGRLDLVIEFTANSTGLQVGDTLAKLTGTLNNGRAITGSSSVSVRR